LARHTAREARVPQSGHGVRAYTSAAQKAALAGGDSGPARREISASESRSSVMDMTASVWKSWPSLILRPRLPESAAAALFYGNPRFLSNRLMRVVSTVAATQ